MRQHSGVDIIADFGDERAGPAASYAEDIRFEKQMQPDVRAVTYASLVGACVGRGNRPLVMAMLWNDVERDLASSRRHLTLPVGMSYERGGAVPSQDQYVRTTGFLHAMQSRYTSFEAGMKRLLALLDDLTNSIRTERPWQCRMPACFSPASARRWRAPARPSTRIRSARP